MFHGPAVVAALKACSVTHVVWIPDTELGRWDEALSTGPDLQLIRVCREGEAISIAGGLQLGGKRPIVLLQCTGLFEAGDALRHVLFDLRLPLFMIVGVRSWKAYQRGMTSDTCPRFIEPYLNAWGLTYRWLGDGSTLNDLVEAYCKAHDERRPCIALYAE